MAGRSRLHDLPGSIIAAAFMALGIMLAAESRGMSEMGSVFPTTISVALILFSAALIVRNVVLGLRRPAGADPPPRRMESNPRRLGFVVAMAAWIGLIPVVGFFAASLPGFFAVMAVTARGRMPPRQTAILCVSGLAILALFYWIMTSLLMLPMPRGLLF